MELPRPLHDFRFPPEILSATLAADHPKIAALAASIDARAGQGRPAERERALLADLVERSREHRAARLARLPRPHFPEELPIAQHRDKIAALIRDHPVTIVCGETGSGKTTQIPEDLPHARARRRGPHRLHAAAAHRRAQPRAPPRAGARRRAEGLRRPQDPLPGRDSPRHRREGDDRRHPPRRDALGPRAARLRHDHRRRGARAQPQRRFPARLHEAPREDAPRAQGDRHLRHHRHRALLAVLRRRAGDRGVGAHLSRRGALSPRVLRGRGRGRRAGRHERGDREGGGRDRARSAAGRHPRLPPGRARDPRGGRGAAQAPPEEHRDPAALLAPLGRGAGPRLRARPAPAHRARDQRRRDFAHRPGHPLRDRHGPRAREALLAAAEDRPAAHRAHLAGGGAPARGPLRARRERHRDPPLRRGGFRGAPRVHHAGDPAHLARLGDPAHGGARAGADRGIPFIEPPTPRQIEDGYRQLFELGAIDDARNLTPLGHELARLPVDPRIGRLLLASREFNCLSEMVILAAALSIQDPRDRPQALREGVRPRARGIPRRGLGLPAAAEPVEVLRQRVHPQEIEPQALRDLPRAFPLVRAHARVARPRRAAARDGLRAEDPRQPHARDLRADPPRAPDRASSATSA